MDKKLFKELDTNLKEAVKIANGTTVPKSVYVVLSPAEIKTIRKSVNMSQAAFARSFQLSLDTLKGWEQGKRRPDGAAANFLRMIKADPEFVQRTLATWPANAHPMH
jgi:putative transcriptional regulator